jgi:hypothetical protein
VRGMSNGLRAKSFKHGEFLVKYFRDSNGMFNVCIDFNGLNVCDWYDLFNIDNDAKILTENARKSGIDVSVDVAREILRRVSEGYGEEVVGKTTVVVGDHVLDVHLPHDGRCDGGKCNAPPWAKDLVIGNFEEPDGGNSIITHTHEDNQYVVVAVRSEGGGEPKYSLIAVLPRFMGRVYDPFYNEWFFVALLNGRLIAVSSELDDFIKTITNSAENECYVKRNMQNLSFLKKFMPKVKAVVSAGITDDGFVDPYGVLDVTDYGVDPLLKAYEWIRKYYPETNAKWAWFNVMAVFAKVLTPLVRYYNKTFNDMIVYNVGRGGEGKSTLVRYVLVPLLGGDVVREDYYVVIDGAVKTEPQLRNLLSLNRLPLILDEQNRRALTANVGVFLSAVVGLGTVGVHASRYGLGIAVKFKNLRGLVVFTNVPFSVVQRDLVSEANDFAIVRRFIEVSWDSEPVSPKAFRDLPSLKPIYGFAVRLWQRHKVALIESVDLLDLIRLLSLAIAREYGGDDKVNELVRFTLNITKELGEFKRGELLSLSDVDVLVGRAYDFVGSELRTTQLTPVKVLRFIIENQRRAGIRLGKPKNRESLDKLKTELDIAIHKHLMYRYGIEDSTNGDITGKDQDAITLYTLLKNAYDNDLVMAIIMRKSPLLPGMPRTFMGARIGTYIIDGRKEAGYAIPLARLVRVFLAGEGDKDSEVEVEVDGEGTEKPQSDG